MAQSGGMFEATPFARACEVSRTTIATYLSVLEATLVVHVIRPFARRRTAEIVAAPKVYGFDTGFVCYHRGWHSLRREDLGLLWEHLVLNEIHAHLGARDIHYWRSKLGNEVDFVLPQAFAPFAVPTRVASTISSRRTWIGPWRGDTATSPCAASPPRSSSTT
jgi:uncharacterized protein